MTDLLIKIWDRMLYVQVSIHKNMGWDSTCPVVLSGKHKINKNSLINIEGQDSISPRYG